MENQQTQGALRYYLYARKSSEAEDRQVASIEAQIAELQRVARDNNLNIIGILTESQSAKAPGRPVFNELLEHIRQGGAEGIICWKLDRLARNPIDGGQISWMLQKNIIKQIQTFGRVYYPTDNVLMMQVELGMANQYIIDLSVNVKRGLRAKCEKGLWPAPAPTGYLNEKWTDRKGYIIQDPERAPVIRQIFEKAGYEGWSGRRIHQWLLEIGFTTYTGKKIWLSNVQKILNTPLYSGEFEYPMKSGHWYKGIHEPIITKELYDMVQENMHTGRNFRYRIKEFAFTRLMKCGKCGSGVTAQEKYKKLKDGTTARYVYYGCTRSRDTKCLVEYIREENLLEQILQVIDRVSLDESGIRKRLQNEMERYYKFQSVLGIAKQNTEHSDVDIRNYAKYILQTSSITERRDLLSHLRGRLILTSGTITLE